MQALLIGFFLTFVIPCSSLSIYPIIDSQENNLPRNFRVMCFTKCPFDFNDFGLMEMRASGSGQFSEDTFEHLIQHLPILLESLIIVDLREESHGFINGLPISWTNGENSANHKKNRLQIESDEYQKLESAIRSKQIDVHHLGESSNWPVLRVETEESLVKNRGAKYFRFPVTDRHRPSDEVIDQFIDFIQDLKGNDWIHFHCKGGKGRTTTFLILYDIAKNSRILTLQEILERQHLIGGVDLTQTEKTNEDRTKNAQDRIEFIDLFYRYCNQFPDFQIKWSDWVALQEKGSEG